jgi:D-alanine--poly(phosphoribitol) ligase subunit 2
VLSEQFAGTDLARIVHAGAPPGVNWARGLAISGDVQDLKAEMQKINPVKDDAAATPQPGANGALEGSILEVLERVSGTSAVRENLDVELFDQDILDSFDLMCLILELSDTLHLDIAPAEVERDAWSTPRRIIAYIQNRTGGL